MTIIKGNEEIHKWLQESINFRRKESARNLANKLRRYGKISEEDKNKILEIIASKDPENLAVAEELMKGIRRTYNKKFKWKHT